MGILTRFNPITYLGEAFAIAYANPSKEALEEYYKDKELNSETKPNTQ